MQQSVDEQAERCTPAAEEAEAQLRAMSGRIVSLTDEINQPLTAIANYCETARLLIESLHDNEQARNAASSLEAAIGQVFRASEKVRGLSEFAGQATRKPSDSQA